MEHSPHLNIVLGSIARDRIAHFDGKFAEALQNSDGTPNVAPMFYTPRMVEQWGGTGQNIAMAASYADSLIFNATMKQADYASQLPMNDSTMLLGAVSKYDFEPMLDNQQRIVALDPTHRPELGGSHGHIVNEATIHSGMGTPDDVPRLGEVSHGGLLDHTVETRYGKFDLMALLHTDYVYQSNKLTAMCQIISDKDGNQITAFHPGAMEDSDKSVDLFFDNIPTIHENQLMVISPCSKSSMLNAVELCNINEMPFLFDPGQAHGLFDADNLNYILASGLCLGLLCNKTEAAYICEQLELDSIDQVLQLRLDEDVARRPFYVFNTLGDQGCNVFVRALVENEERNVVLHSSAVQLSQIGGKVVDPTGCGDAFRGGILALLAYGTASGGRNPLLAFDEFMLSWLGKGLAAGTYMAAACVQNAGPQSYIPTEVDDSGAQAPYLFNALLKAHQANIVPVFRGTNPADLWKLVQNGLISPVGDSLSGVISVEINRFEPNIA
jgi:sugar/nucleoside kinase (ribokinase family)